MVPSTVCIFSNNVCDLPFFLFIISAVSSKPPQDQDTRHFLLKQETIWKGFLNMQTVAKFVTKGYLVSGSSKYLNEVRP